MEESASYRQPGPKVQSLLESSQGGPGRLKGDKQERLCYVTLERGPLSPHTLQPMPHILCRALPPHSHILMCFSLVNSAGLTQKTLWDLDSPQRSTGPRWVAAGLSVPWDVCSVALGPVLAPSLNMVNLVTPFSPTWWLTKTSHNLCITKGFSVTELNRQLESGGELWVLGGLLMSFHRLNTGGSQPYYTPCPRPTPYAHSPSRGSHELRVTL